MTQMSEYPVGSRVRIKTPSEHAFNGKEGVISRTTLSTGSSLVINVCLDGTKVEYAFEPKELIMLETLRPQDAPNEEQKDALIEALTKKAEDALEDKARLEQMLKTSEQVNESLKAKVNYYAGLYRVQVGAVGAVRIQYFAYEKDAKDFFFASARPVFMDQREAPAQAWKTVRTQW